MGYVAGFNRNQVSIISLDQFIDENNPCRVIDAFVSSLDLNALGFKYAVTKNTGRPPFDPGDILKLYLYGHQNKVHSSRRLEAETMRNVEVMWLMNGLTPDDKTICNFRKDNPKALKEVFREFNKFCLYLGLFGKDTVSIDGTKIKADNSRNNYFAQKDAEKILSKLDKKIAEYLCELDQNDAAQDKELRPDPQTLGVALEKIRERKTEIEAILKAISENDGNPICTIDEDATLMKQGGNKGFDVCYNVQSSMDEKNGLVVDYNVTSHANDLGELSDMVKRSKEMLEVDKLNVLADTGYSSGEEIKLSEDMGARCYIPKQRPSHQPKNDDLSRNNFKYDAKTNTYTCPAGNVLPQVRTRERDGYKVYVNRKACNECPFKSECTKSQTVRVIERSPYQENIDRANKNAKDNPNLYQRRMELSEHPFGVVKRIWGFDQFLCRGIELVTGEAALAFIAFNLRRVVNIVGVKKLVEAINNSVFSFENSLISLFGQLFTSEIRQTRLG